jgi:hypothetical protein
MELDCKIYVEAELEPDDLAKTLAESLSGASLCRTVKTPLCEIDIRMNAEADKARVREFPDGFLFFRYTLEIYPSPAARREDRVALTATLLRLFWSQGLPAVAACDYEDELLFGGGYNNRSVPWVSLELLPRKARAAAGQNLNLRDGPHLAQRNIRSTTLRVIFEICPSTGSEAG